MVNQSLDSWILISISSFLTYLNLENNLPNSYEVADIRLNLQSKNKIQYIL